MRLYPRMIWHMEAPKYNLYPWFVCELVRKHVTVCLSGNGGDEVFGGYVARYQHALRIERLSHNPLSPLLQVIHPLEGLPSDTGTRNRFRVLQALGDQIREYLILAGAMPESFNKKLFKDADYSQGALQECYTPFFQAGASFLDNLMKAELRTKLVDDLLSVDDSMSMAHSLELRVPLLDNRIVDLMTTLPWQSKLHDGYGKILLRQVVKDLLPEKTLQKPKWGFSVDVNAWYQGEAGELIRQVVPESSVITQYFSKTMMQKLIDRAKSPTERRFQVLLWQLLGFHFWHRIFIDGERPENVPLEVTALTN
jgi:asparagine synthase (glutamine-hydrolysing)